MESLGRSGHPFSFGNISVSVKRREFCKNFKYLYCQSLVKKEKTSDPIFHYTCPDVHFLRVLRMFLYYPVPTILKIDCTIQAEGSFAWKKYFCYINSSEFHKICNLLSASSSLSFCTILILNGWYFTFFNRGNIASSSSLLVRRWFHISTLKTDNTN